MRKISLTVSVLLAVYIIFVLYANRALYTTPFDIPYWKDKYEHSQWKLPLSPRIIGDDGLYVYEGYRLITGGDPTLLNAEVPPLGKYLIGATIRLTNTAAVYGLWTTILLIFLTYSLARVLLVRTEYALIAALLTATDPLITNQYALTMLDAIQAAALLLFFRLLLSVKRASDAAPLRVLAAGTALGLFSEIKAPILTPIVAAVSLWYLWATTRRMSHIILFCASAAAGYLIPYMPYVFQGHTLLEWLKVQKWIVSFYKNSNLTATWGSAILTLFTGRYQNLFTRAWITAPEWTPVWGAMAIATLLSIRSRPWRNLSWMTLGGTLVLIIGIYAVLPFWTRYLIVILPMLYIAGIGALTRLPSRIWLPATALFLSINVAASFRILFPAPTTFIRQTAYNLEHALFADIYQETSTRFRARTDAASFRTHGLTLLADGQIERIAIAIPPDPKYYKRQRNLRVPITITYATRQLGAFTVETFLPVILEDNRWRLDWDWSILFPGATDTSHLATSVTPARRGTIIGSDRKALAEDAPGALVWVTPGKILPSQEDALLSLLETAFDGKIPKVAIHQRIFGNTLSDRAVPVGVIPKPKADPLATSLSRFSAVTFTDAYTRLYHPNNIVELGTLSNTAFSECCTALYSTTNYDGVTGVEKKKNAELKGVNGGTLTLIHSNGEVVRTYLNATARDGNTVEP